MKKTKTMKKNRIPRGLRNCNPLNIRKSGDNWVGQCGHDGTFVQFLDIKYGIRAAFRLLYTYNYRYDCNTVMKIINRWAPPKENNTLAYIHRVCDYGNFSPDEIINVHYTSHKEKSCKLIAAMAYVELGGDYLTSSIIGEAYDMAFPKNHY